MSSVLSDLRTGLATNLATISGLRTSATVPADPKPPFAMILPSSVTFGKTFVDAMHDYEFTVRVIVGKVDDRTAQNTLDAYCASTGSTSIKAAIESDQTLGGKCFDLQVLRVSNYGVFQMNESTYLGAEFSVQVFAP